MPTKAGDSVNEHILDLPSENRNNDSPASEHTIPTVCVTTVGILFCRDIDWDFHCTQLGPGKKKKLALKYAS